MERVSASKTKKDLGKAAFQAAAILLEEFRSGKLGRMTLEIPVAED